MKKIKGILGGNANRGKKMKRKKGLFGKEKRREITQQY